MAYMIVLPPFGYHVFKFAARFRSIQKPPISEMARNFQISRYARVKSWAEIDGTNCHHLVYNSEHDAFQSSSSGKFGLK
jgi:hypothetical protein